MEKIEVVYKETGVPGTYHKYILYTDSKGNVSYARGGPTMGQFGILGSINAQRGDYIDGTPDYIAPSKDIRHHEVIASRDNLSNEWNAVLTAMDDLDSQYLYSPVSQNSNTTVDWALLYAGLPLPSDDDRDEYFAPASILSPEYPPLMIPFFPAAVVGLIPDFLAPVAGLFGDVPAVPVAGGGGDPLVLDLDGDGIEVTKLGYGVGASTAYFDMDNDGFAERTAWIKGGDGLLAIDRNGNGKIDSQSELFGNNNIVADGFTNLKTLDSNKDNKITAADAQFKNLRVWVDANGDGKTDAGELKTLSALKITQINLGAKILTGVTNNENIVAATSSFVMNGTAKKISEVWFRNDTTDTRYAGDSTLDVRALFLPTLKGYGNLKDLHVAMSEDETLLTMVHNLVNKWSIKKFANPSALDNEVKAILYKWAGVDDVVDGSRGTLIDAKVLTFMEALTGAPYGANSTFGFTEPTHPVHVPPVLNAFEIAFDSLKAQLLTQAGAGGLFTTTPVYNIAAGELSDASLSISAITALKNQALTLTSSARGAFWISVSEYILNVKDKADLSAAEVNALNSAIVASGIGKTWESISSQVLSQYSANYRTTELSDNVVGLQGDDSLSGLGGVLSN